MSNRYAALGVSAAALVLGLVIGASLAATAFAARPEAAAVEESPFPVTHTPVVCTQVRQTNIGVDEKFVASFMSEQLDAGRGNFQAVQGLSLVLCAY